MDPASITSKRRVSFAHPLSTEIDDEPFLGVGGLITGENAYTDVQEWLEKPPGYYASASSCAPTPARFWSSVIDRPPTPIPNLHKAKDKGTRVSEEERNAVLQARLKKETFGIKKLENQPAKKRLDEAEYALKISNTEASDRDVQEVPFQNEPFHALLERSRLEEKVPLTPEDQERYDSLIAQSLARQWAQEDKPEAESNQLFVPYEIHTMVELFQKVSTEDQSQVQGPKLNVKFDDHVVAFVGGGIAEKVVEDKEDRDNIAIQLAIGDDLRAELDEQERLATCFAETSRLLDLLDPYSRD